MTALGAVLSALALYGLWIDFRVRREQRPARQRIEAE